MSPSLLSNTHTFHKWIHGIRRHGKNWRSIRYRTMPSGHRLGHRPGILASSVIRAAHRGSGMRGYPGAKSLGSAQWVTQSGQWVPVLQTQQELGQHITVINAFQAPTLYKHIQCWISDKNVALGGTCSEWFCSMHHCICWCIHILGCRYLYLMRSIR